jgi:hypothetical protein
VNQLSFTEHLISSQINNADWFEDISDYIEWNVGSFGHPPIGLHVYLRNLMRYIETTTSDIPEDKRKKLSEFVNSFLKPRVADPDKEVDLNALHDAYQKWLNIFPFEINYFNELKKHFSKMLPIVKNVTTNRYSGIAKAEMITSRDLVENLLETTKQLLKKVDSVDLLNKKLIDNPQRQHIEIINESHRVEQTSLLDNFNKGESEYLTLIKKWLNNEKKYFKVLIPLLDKGRSIFDHDIISSISDKAYSEIIERILEFGKNLEKFQSMYQNLDEEKFRDFFLPHLNAISKKHSGTGETFNKKGKTDILIQDNDSNNVFIAECKLWNGQAELKKAVDQLLERYVNWRDERTAIIIFNKEVKGFSDVISKAIDALKGHPRFETFIGHRKDSSYSFIFNHPEDSKKTVKLELILFNCTQSE